MVIQAHKHEPVASSPWKANPSKPYPEGRVCANPECGKALARLNPGPLCWPCQDAKERAALDKLPKFTGLKPATERRVKRQEKGVMRKALEEIDGITLVPAAVPPRQSNGRDWRRVVQAFVASGENCCEVRTNGIGHKGTYDAVMKAIKGLEYEHPVAYATVRKGVCYLVRITK